jgi:SAM-dependent methyltransferase
MTTELLGLYDQAIGRAAGDTATGFWLMVGRLAQSLGVSVRLIAAILCYAPPIALAYVLVERPLRFGLGVAAVLLVGALPAALDRNIVYRDRGFFGVLRVASGIDPDAPFSDDNHPSRRLMHGNILHGKQYLEDEYRREPVTYYDRTGPIGLLLSAYAGDRARNDVAVIGLGTGTMAAYANPGQRYTFYEIDPKVKALSFDQSTYFSYVKDAKDRGAEVNVVLGDGRLSLDRERASKPDQKFDLIVVDGFTSDAIPVHLLTREALRVYRDRLKGGGVVVFHISNRYLNLEPVLANLAAAEGMACLMQSDDQTSRATLGKRPSTWVALAEHEADLAPLPRFKFMDLSWPYLRDVFTRAALGDGEAEAVLEKLRPLNNRVFQTREDFLQAVAGVLDGKRLEQLQDVILDSARRWDAVQGRPDVGVWTDDYSNLIRVFRWKGTD